MRMMSLLAISVALGAVAADATVPVLIAFFADP